MALRSSTTPISDDVTVPVFRPAGADADAAPRRTAGLDDFNFPFEEPLHEVFPALHGAQSAWMGQIDSLPAPDRKTHELIRLVCTVVLAITPGSPATPGSRGGRRPVGRGARLDHAHRARPSGCSPRSRRSRSPAPASTPPNPRRTTEWRRPTPSRRSRSGSCRGSPTSTAASGPAGRKASCASSGARTAATTSTRPTPICPMCHSKRLAFEAVSGRGDGAHLLGQPPALDAGAGAAVRRRDRRAPRAGGPAPDDEHRRLRARGRVGSACRCGSSSSTTRIPTVTCSSRCSHRSRGMKPESIDGHQRRRPVRRRAAPAPRPARAHARRVPGRDRGRGTHDRRHRRHRDLSGPDVRPAGVHGAGVVDVQDALRLEIGWWTGGIELPGQLGSVIDACLAVAAGLATHVLCFRSVWEGSAQGDKGRASTMPGGGGGGGFKATGFMEWTLPFAAPSAAPWIAMMAQRHFHEFGTTREQMAQIAFERAHERGVEPQGDLHRPDDDGRLPRDPDDLLARCVSTTATSRVTAGPP